MSGRTTADWVAYRQLETWYKHLLSDPERSPNAFIGNADPSYRYVNIYPTPFRDVSIQPLNPNLMKLCCTDTESRTVRDRAVGIKKFRFLEQESSDEIPYGAQVATVFALGLIQLGNNHELFKRYEHSPFRQIKSIPECIVFDPEDWYDEKREPVLYDGLADKNGEVQTCGVGMVFGGRGCYGCILGTSLPSGVSEVPQGKVLRSEIWALLMTMMSSNGNDPGPCLLFSFTDTHARVIIAEFTRSDGKYASHLKLHVAFNKKLILDASGSFDPVVYWEMFSWGCFQQS